MEEVEDIKTIRFSGIDRRIMIILSNKERWISVSSIYKLLLRGYVDGSVDRRYSYNWVAMRLRELSNLGLIDKKVSKEGDHGNYSLYVINAYGLSQLRLNVNSYNNSAVGIERKSDY